MNQTKPRKKRKKPVQRELPVQKDIIKQLRNHGFSVHRVEAKAFVDDGNIKYSETEAGVSDIIGNDKHGYATYIEVKAPGKLRTLRRSQYFFLVEKINTGCFACVADSFDLVMDRYKMWFSMITGSPYERQEAAKYLFDHLPKHFDNFQIDFD